MILESVIASYVGQNSIALLDLKWYSIKNQQTKSKGK